MKKQAGKAIKNKAAAIELKSRADKLFRVNIEVAKEVERQERSETMLRITARDLVHEICAALVLGKIDRSLTSSKRENLVYLAASCVREIADLEK